MKLKKITIGQVYLTPEMFQDEANKLIGAPAISNEVIHARRKVTSNITIEGETYLQEVKEIIQRNYDLKVTFKWDRFAGCKMCPCSPGFVIKAEMDNEQAEIILGYKKSLPEKFRFDVFANGSRPVISESKFGFFSK